MTLSSTPSNILSSAGQKIQALLFVAVSPVSLNEIVDLLSIPPAAAAEEVCALQDFLQKTGQGLVLQEAPEGWRMTTAEETAEVVSLFRSTVLVQKIRLSKAAVETLAVIAYNQPVT
ncbi:MAG: SMC-Scp complex subunit ScpB, partial [Synergistaceae bacterium]|nr:SMC-Scp complex subunit ScpB [Synergistaceae bacterium]